MRKKEHMFSRIIKILSIILLLIMLLLLIASGYYLLNTRLIVEGSSASVYNAAQPEVKDRFISDRNSLGVSAVQGTVFRVTDLADDENCEYVFYTLRLKNTEMFKAETVEISLNRQMKDILFYMPYDREITINPGASTDITCILLREKGAENTARDLRITYYYLGKMYQMRYTYDR